MKLVSTRGGQVATFRTALFDGLAPDGGLYVPETIPAFSAAELLAWRGKPFEDLAAGVFQRLLEGEFTPDQIHADCIEAFRFKPALRLLKEKLFVLELFHGPTCAFKDFGARFLAALTRRALREENRKLVILVATSGDTGSAVAQAFFDVEAAAPVRVIVLYPKGRVSEIQERQMAVLGHNIIALEVDGSFDDCQSLVKEAFQDAELRAAGALSSANSINIARLLPQALYYIWAALELWDSGPLEFSIPSGNLGNLAAAVIAGRLGAPIGKLIAPTNANSVFGKYLATGKFSPRASVQTASNAMDVGSPSNLERLVYLYGGSVEKMRAEIASPSFTDTDTARAVKSVQEAFQYTMDPHTAVGYLGTGAQPSASTQVIAGTAHPAKFGDFVFGSCGVRPELPPQLAKFLNSKKLSISIRPEYAELRRTLLEAF